ncbi:MAG: hypothetical protein MUP85_13645 [Candidatus Lokiarchaeota archaeon]|nr:hypothetical protein [Candidatus Lokiarchaeota archaeon]
MVSCKEVTNRPDWKSGASGGCMRISNTFCYSSMYRQEGARNWYDGSPYLVL